MTQVRLQINGERGVITVDTLVATLQRIRTLLQELDHTSRHGKGTRGRWAVADVWNGSIGLALEPSADVPAEVPIRLVDGLALLENRPELPPWFSESAIENVHKMGNLLEAPGVSGIDITAVTSADKKATVQLTPLVIQHAAEAFEGMDDALGSVTGILDVVNLRQRRRTVSLYDVDARHAVRFTFPGNLFETVRECLGVKVQATGTVTRNPAGQITSVKVDTLSPLEDGSLAPTVAELTGIAPWLTGERDSVEYQQWSRGA
ncbi:MAG: hypothetical protein ACYDGY_10260 [Acidimicrobiales bacterium]